MQVKWHTPRVRLDQPGFSGFPLPLSAWSKPFTRFGPYWASSCVCCCPGRHACGPSANGSSAMAPPFSGSPLHFWMIAVGCKILRLLRCAKRTFFNVFGVALCALLEKEARTSHMLTIRSTLDGSLVFGFTVGLTMQMQRSDLCLPFKRVH